VPVKKIVTKLFNAISDYQKKHRAEIIEGKEDAKRKYKKHQKTFLEGGIVATE
jgi:nucleosome binding factor SPN SPT16 subunit